MRDTNPRAMIAIGFVLVLLGFVVPLLMVTRIIESNLALSFISHGASVGGLFLGILGGALYVRKQGE
jgi:membrane associated rhomboid family serine protease